jgi:hypothetical protein
MHADDAQNQLQILQSISHETCIKVSGCFSSCFICNFCVEDELHVLIQCQLYAIIRQMMSNVHFYTYFTLLSDTNVYLYFYSVTERLKTCNNILIRRYR